MKICMMSLAMEGSSALEVVRTAVACGMTAVDWITTHGEKASVLRHLCREEGLFIAAHTPLDRGFVEGRNDGIDEFRRSLEAAVEMEAPVIMVPPFPFTHSMSMEEARKKWISFYRKAMPYVREAGRTLCMESTGFLQSPVVTGPELRELLDAVPGLKIAFDNGNAATAGDMGETFDAVRDHVVHFHLKDWKITPEKAPYADLKRNGKWHADCVIGEGDLDLKRFWTEHVKPYYDGFVNLETCDPSGKRSPREVLLQCSELLREW